MLHLQVKTDLEGEILSHYESEEANALHSREEFAKQHHELCEHAAAVATHFGSHITCIEDQTGQNAKSGEAMVAELRLEFVKVTEGLSEQEQTLAAHVDALHEIALKHELTAVAGSDAVMIANTRSEFADLADELCLNEKALAAHLNVAVRESLDETEVASICQ